VTEVGALSAAGWALCARCRHTLRWEVGVASGAWPGRCTSSRPEWLAGRNRSVRLDWGVLVVFKNWMCGQ